MLIRVLKKIIRQKTSGYNGSFTIVASKYNERYVDSMLEAARRVLTDASAQTIEVVRVPGAFEIPVVAAKLARSKAPRFEASAGAELQIFTASVTFAMLTESC